MRARDLFENDTDSELEELVTTLGDASKAEARNRWQTVRSDVNKALYRNPDTGFSMKLVRTLPTADLCWVYVYDEGGDFVDGDSFDLEAGYPLDDYFTHADQMASTMIQSYSISTWKRIFGQTKAA